MMTPEELLPVLLRAGLWGTAEKIPQEDCDLDAVRELARSLAVSGIVSDGISSLVKAYPDLKISLEQLKPFIKEILYVERTNSMLDTLLLKVIDLLEGQGLRPVILKGQAIARH